jgi:Rieske [2Fe-2S] domain
MGVFREQRIFDNDESLFRRTDTPRLSLCCNCRGRRRRGGSNPDPANRSDESGCLNTCRRRSGRPRFEQNAARSAGSWCDGGNGRYLWSIARLRFFKLFGICTHLGCIPKFDPLPNATEPAADWLGGYFCPCHGSKYDLAGRVFRGVPAPYNLPVPPYHFVNDTMIRIGENPPDVIFDFASIRQL